MLYPGNYFSQPATISACIFPYRPLILNLLLVTSKDNIFHALTLARLASHICLKIFVNLCAKKVRLLENSITQSARKTCTSEDDIENIKLNVVHVRRLLIQFQHIHPFCWVYSTSTTFFEEFQAHICIKELTFKGNK